MITSLQLYLKYFPRGNSYPYLNPTLKPLSNNYDIV